MKAFTVTTHTNNASGSKETPWESGDVKVSSSCRTEGFESTATGIKTDHTHSNAAVREHYRKGTTKKDVLRLHSYLIVCLIAAAIRCAEHLCNNSEKKKKNGGHGSGKKWHLSGPTVQSNLEEIKRTGGERGRESRDWC